MMGHQMPKKFIATSKEFCNKLSLTCYRIAIVDSPKPPAVVGGPLFVVAGAYEQNARPLRRRFSDIDLLLCPTK